MANSQSGDSMIDRLVRVLGSFDPDHQSLSTEELSERAALPKSTAYRLINDMMRHNLLQRDPNGRLRIGVGMWELSNRASDAVDLATLARPHMMAVHDFVGENTQLGILREREVLIIERM
ncbi:MAG: helix-turn-helix domain-containing protein, partial [Brevibacterium aurantiacum]